MEIAIDGLNLGLKEGSGIATYSRELSRVLEERGNRVSVLYGLNGVGRDGGLMWRRFLQSLVNRGECSRHDRLDWGLYFALYAMSDAAWVPIRARRLIADPSADISAIGDKLPRCSQFYNLPGIFRASQAFALFRKRPLAIELEGAPDVDIFHVTSPLPLKMPGRPNVVTLHDVIPLTLPYSTEVNLRHYRRILEIAVSSADLIFTTSEWSKRDIVNTLDIGSDRVHVTYQTASIPDKYAKLKDRDIAAFLWKEHQLKLGEYYLYVGAVEPKKNVARIISAMSFARTDLPLVVVGKNAWLFADVERQIRELHMRAAGRRRIRRLQHVPFDTLMYLMKGAKALLFPSLSEGFGLPVLEAMQLGCPVITSNRSAIPEVAGDAALYVDPVDVRGIADAIDKIADDSALRSELADRGLKQSRKFSPEAYYSKLEQGYEMAKAAYRRRTERPASQPYRPATRL